jgi:hypothetical protein
MICSVKPVLTEELCIVKRQEFFNNVLCVPSIFIRDKTIFSSEVMLHKDYYRKSLVEKKASLVVGLKGLDAKTK